MLKDNEKIKASSTRETKSVRQPERSRQILINAALDSIAEIGIGDTTVSRIIERAGLSRGMIHLHFGGKDNLLAAAAEAFSLEYYTEMDRQIAGLERDPVALVMAVVGADLSEDILNKRSVKIWHAFRGASSANADVARFSDTRDKRLRTMLHDAFSQIVDADNPESSALMAKDATYGTLVMLEGMWTDYLTHLENFSRPDANRIIQRFLSGLFPRWFE